MPELKVIEAKAFSLGQMALKGLKGAAIAGLAAAGSQVEQGKFSVHGVKVAFIAAAAGFFVESVRNWIKNR